MNRNEIIEKLELNSSPIATVNWLRNVYFSEIMDRFNLPDSRKRFALYQGEQIPVNERNLTDVRTRMGVLIEFELARLSNDLLRENNINGIFWSYVVANRFPDLEIRRSDGNRLLRLEIKCLQCIAEEKSANFDTLRKDIDPSADYVIVGLWDWEKNTADEFSWDSTPMLKKIYVFNAYSLALLRDTYWLNRPPTDLGSGYQGFDIRYAVTCTDGVFSKEQGNYGKLTRIWKQDFAYPPPESEITQDTITEYLKFQREIIWAGFEILAKNHLIEFVPDNSDLNAVYDNERNIVGYQKGDLLYLLTSSLSRTQCFNIANRNDATCLVTMTEKYRCSVFQKSRDSWNAVSQNQKPKNVNLFIHRSES